MRIIEWHIEGDYRFMLPLTVLLMIMIGLFIRYILSNQKNSVVENWLLIGIRQIGYFCFFFGLLGQVIGLIYAFDSLEASATVISQQMIAGGLKVSFYTTTYGIIILLISQIMVFYITKVRGKEIAG